MKLLLALLFVSTAAQAEPFDEFVGRYTAVSSPQIQKLRSPTCNKFNFAELKGLEVVADRTGFRQTHSLKLIVPDGYSLVRVVPWYKDPSELDPTIGQYGQSEGDETKATTVTGTFGLDKNEILELKLERIATGVRLTVSNEIKTKSGLIINGCYYVSDLVVATSEP